MGNRRCKIQTYQEDDRDVESKSDHGVGEQDKPSEIVDVGHGHFGHLDDQGDDSVHKGAGRSEVVERNQGIHLELGRGKQALNHVQADSLKGNSGNLEEETSEDKLDFTKRGDDDTNDNERDIGESLHVWRRSTHDPACQEHGDRSGGLRFIQSVTNYVCHESRKTCLEHLNEGDTQIDVCEVAANQRQGEEDTNGHDGSKVDPAGHGDLASRVEGVSEASHDLRHEGGEGQMPCCQEDGKTCPMVSWRAVGWIADRMTGGAYGNGLCRESTCCRE